MPRHRQTPASTRVGGRKGTMSEPAADAPPPEPEQNQEEAGPSEENASGKRPADGDLPSTAEQPLGLKRQKMATGHHGLVVGPRIPYQYFVTQGYGDTDEGAGSDPFETGSYDMALEMAKIHQFNIMQYTSVLPPESVELPLSNAEPNFMHGAVLECIMSTMHGTKGDRITAGVGRIHVRRKKDQFVIGGYAAEYKGHATKEDATKSLQEDLRGIFARRYDTEEYESFGESYTVQEHEVKKGYGTVLASICFTSFIMPEI